MPTFICLWDDEDDHPLQHGITRDEFEEVVQNPDWVDFSRSTDRPIAFGRTSTGKRIACVYEDIDGLYIVPITAYETE